jgi:hypothetical protein
MAYAPLSQEDLDAFHGLLHTQTPTTAKKAPGNFLTHLLPTIGGTGGAIGGAALGTALLPGVGTLAGALLGGALGGGGAKVGENAVEHQALGNGVAGQAVEQGVLGAGPIRLLKAGTIGLKAGITAAKDGGLEGAIQAANDVIKTPVLAKTGRNLITQGEQAQGRTLGLSSGSKAAGKQIGTQDTQNMLQILQKHGIDAANANNAERDISAKLNQYGSQIGDHFNATNVPLTTAETKGISTDFMAQVKSKESDPRIIKEYQVLADNLQKNVKDTKGLWEYRKALDDRLPDNKQGATDLTLTNQQKAIKDMRGYLSDNLGDVPGMKDYHELSSVKPFVLGETNRLNNPGGGIIGRVLGSGPVQKAENMGGRAVQKVGNTLAGNTPDAAVPGLTAKAIAGRTLPLGAAQAFAGNAAAQMGQQGSAETQPTDLTGALSAAQNSSQAPTSSSPYSQENLMADIQRDPKHASDYISTYESLDKIFNPPSATATIKPTSQQYGLAQGGVNSLQQLASSLQQNSSLVSRNATPGQGLPLVGSLITNAAGVGDYHALADSVLQSLIHLQTGATATPEEVKAARGQLPQPGDSAEVQQQKLQNLYAMFQPYVSGNQGTSSDSTDLASVLSQLGYSGQ